MQIRNAQINLAIAAGRRTSRKSRRAGLPAPGPRPAEPPWPRPAEVAAAPACCRTSGNRPVHPSRSFRSERSCRRPARRPSERPWVSTGSAPRRAMRPAKRPAGCSSWASLATTGFSHSALFWRRFGWTHSNTAG